MRRVQAPTECNVGSLAQLVEQLAFNQFVEGSNPSRPTNSRILFIYSQFKTAVSSAGRAVGF